MGGGLEWGCGSSGEKEGGKEKGIRGGGGSLPCQTPGCPLKYHSSPGLGVLHLQIPDFSVVEKTDRVEGCGNRLPRSLSSEFIADFIS